MHEGEQVRVASWQLLHAFGARCRRSGCWSFPKSPNLVDKRKTTQRDLNYSINCRRKCPRISFKGNRRVRIWSAGEEKSKIELKKTFHFFSHFVCFFEFPLMNDVRVRFAQVNQQLAFAPVFVCANNNPRSIPDPRSQQHKH